MQTTEMLKDFEEVAEQYLASLEEYSLTSRFWVFECGRVVSPRTYAFCPSFAPNGKIGSTV